jgi:hypothetical protein
MPTYEYHCPTNGQTVEVRHGMNEMLNTWGEVCKQAGITPGDTAMATPVERLISGGTFISSRTLKNPEPGCSTGMCGGGMCGLN